MGKTTSKIPGLKDTFKNVGENIKLARLRRKLSTTMISERAGITRMTLRAIERGKITVAIGNYGAVLFCLGLSSDLELLAKDDVFGRKLQDIELLRVREEDLAPLTPALRGRANARTAMERANSLGAVPDWLTVGEIRQIEAVYVEAAQLSDDTGVPREVDHVIALRGRSKRGLHILSNLQILTEKENQKKGNR